MRKLPALLVLLLFAYPSFAQDSIVRWKTIVGLITAPGVQNLVGSIPSGAFPWATTGGSALVNLSNGDIRFRVEGLSVVGGTTIGTSRLVPAVRGTLVCIFGATEVHFDTELVPLSSQGDAEFEGNLGTVPDRVLCGNPLFLIRNPGGAWIAAGMVRTMSSEAQE